MNFICSSDLENYSSRGQLKCDGTRAETRFPLSAKWTSPFKLEGASVQSTTGSRGGRISSTNVGYTMFQGSVKSTGYPLYSPVSPSLPRPCVTECHHISTGVYIWGMIPGKQKFFTPYHVSMIATVITIIVITRTSVFI